MKFVKLYPALKDPAMRYPRIANALLDCGMVAMLSSVGPAIYALLAGNASLFVLALSGFISGVVGVYIAERIAKLRKPCTDMTTLPNLRRVK